MSEGVIGRAWRLLRDHELKEELLRKKIWKIDVSECILFLMILVYSIIFSYYSIMRHYSLRTYAWDIGIITQSLSSVRKGYLFKNNIELFFSPSGAYFGVHFAPIYFLIVPFFYLFPSVEALFVMQSFVLSLSTIPVYFIARHHLNDRLTILFLSISYLLNPLLHSMNWYDFLPQTFLPIFILSATYYLKKRKLKLFNLFILLSLMTIEQASYFIMLYGLYVISEVKNELKELLKLEKFSIASLMPFFVILIAIIWNLFASHMISVFNPTRSAEYEAIENFAFLNIRYMSELPRRVITNLDLALKAIQFNFPIKILYILINFAPTCFISLLKPLAVLPALLWLILSMLSNWGPYYELGFQYTGLTLPFITIGMLEAIDSLPIKIDVKLYKKVYRKFSLMTILVGLVLLMIASPLSPLQKPGDFSYFHDYGITTPSLIDNTIRETIKIIPDQALLISTSTIFPHIATNINAYTIPPLNAPSPRIYTEHIRYLKNIQFEYVIVDAIGNRLQAEVLLNNFIENNNSYGLFIRGPGLYIFKRGYVDAPMNITLKFNYQELAVTDYSVIRYDSSSVSGKVILLKASQEGGRTAWFGPYITMLPGDYVANFKIRADYSKEDKMFKLDVVLNGGSEKVASLEIYGKDFTRPLMWKTFSLPFSIKEKATGVEFRGLNAAKDVNIWLDYIEVIPK